MKTKKPRLETSFGTFAKHYQKYRRSYKKELYNLLFSLMGKNEFSVVDIGCGTGKSTEPLLLNAGKRKISVTGVDPDEAMLAEARKSSAKKKLPITYLQGTAQGMPFKKGTVDAVISGAAFHWFADKKSLAKIKNTLKEGGVLFVFWDQYIKSNKPTIGGEIYGKYNWKGIPKQLRDQAYVSNLLSEAGFRNVAEAKITFSKRQTLPEILGLMKTNSTYAMMSPDTRKAFMKEMTKAYKDALGNKKTVTEKLETRVCYGFK